MSTQEPWAQSLGLEDLQKEVATHYSAWKVPWTEEPSRRLHSTGLQKNRTHLETKYNWEFALEKWTSNALMLNVSCCVKRKNSVPGSRNLVSSTNIPETETF